ncbi:MAG: hypothetical protein C4576_09660 [Desulfobacteraceae bacterium]|nr:MAG: hypothetical protein C4576_09660 [Desulfobacteraceae bacterium]
MAQKRKGNRLQPAVLTFLVWFLATGWAGALSAAPIRIGGKTEIILGSVEQGRRILCSNDEFIEEMSPFDRSARMGVNRKVSAEEFIQFVGTNVAPWEHDERELVENALLSIRAGLESMGFPDLGTITIIKTTGREESDQAYTRDKGVVLPRSIIRNRKTDLRRLLAHELFHVLSRYRTNLRPTLYAAIGFRYSGTLEFPPSLSRVTNPDAPGNDHVIGVKVSGEDAIVMPILFSRSTIPDLRRNSNLFDYLEFALLRVIEGETADSVRPMIGKDGPVLLAPRQVELFFEQIGKNTDYIIHPEEILADNFALLVLGDEHVRSPEILAKIKSILLSKEAE